MKPLTLAALITILIPSCNPRKSPEPHHPAETAPTNPAPAPPSPDPTNPDSLIGLPLKTAQSAADTQKIPHRVIEIDGQPQPATRDHRPQRLNFTVKDGIVTAITKG